MSRTVAALLAAALAVALAGCESSQERSARLEKTAKVHELAESRRNAAKRRLLGIAHPSRTIHVTGVTLLKSQEGLAAAVELRNDSGTAMREVPVRVDVRNAQGKSLFTNETPGQAAPLISASVIPAHASFVWIDDQIPLTAGAVGATAEAGEGSPADGALPQLRVSGAHQIEDPTSGPGAEGQIVNRSSVAQRELVIYAVTRHGGTITAAGRAVVPEAAPGASTRFQLFFIGNPAGGKLEVDAPPSAL